MLRLLSLVVLLGSALPSFASDVIGNGGAGLIVGNRLYLLDLVEAGHTAPVISGQPAAPRILQRVTNAVRLDAATNELVARKLTELAAADPVFALVLIKVMESHTWFVTDQDLGPVGDERSPLHIDPKKLVQMAVRRSPAIYLSQAALRRLDAANRAALVLHEVTYALVTPITDAGQTYQPSWFARQAVGEVFSRDFSRAENRLPLTLGEFLPVGLQARG